MIIDHTPTGRTYIILSARHKHCPLCRLCARRAAATIRTLFNHDQARGVIHATTNTSRATHSATVTPAHQPPRADRAKSATRPPAGDPTIRADRANTRANTH